MKDGLRVLAVISARGSHDAVPHLNIRPLGGKPLIAYTIEWGLKNILHVLYPEFV